jgi:hypothetical protein
MERNHNSGAKDRSQGGKNGGTIRYLLKEYGSAGFILLVLVSAVVVLWPVPGVDCTNGPALDLISEGGPNKSPFFVDAQVIVTGPSSEFDSVNALGNLALIRQCDLHYLRELGGLRGPGRRYFPFSEEALDHLITMRLYHITDGQPVEEVVEAINGMEQSQVSADPNLLVGHSVCGNPHSSEGSPFGGTPKPLPVGEEEAVKLFWEQWAFRHTRVGPFLKDELAGATIKHQGEGVIVSVFDTSPFADTEDDWKTVKWVNPTMDVEPLALKVSYPEVESTITITGPNMHDDVRDHGMFVAGLVHAVAPASEIHLIRVLNEHGCGDLFTLNEALERFTDEVRDESKEEGRTLENVVINLSLGVHDPEEGVILDECNPEDPENDIESLCTALSAAHSEGAVIVAAAGNRPYSEAEAGTQPDNRDESRQAQIPAAYEFVIGVKASNADGISACFSYDGDVFAPGGEGDGDRDCAPNVQGCSDDCPSAVIGPVLSPPENGAYWPTHYAYWSGTSFSTPLVSGLAAVVLQTGLARNGEGGVTATALQNPDWVAKAIYSCTVPPPDGVIHAPSTLIDCLPTCLPPLP